MSGKSGKSLELAYLSGKSLDFEENKLVNIPEHETFILVFEIVKNFCSLRSQPNFLLCHFQISYLFAFIDLALEIAFKEMLKAFLMDKMSGKY